MDYDTFAADFESFRKRATTDREIGFRNVIRLIEPVRGAYVLDYGCGSGYFANMLHEYGADVVGVDISHELIAAAERHTHPDIIYRVIESADLSQFKDGTFDAAVINLVLCILPSPDEILRVLRAIRTKLKPGGTIVALNTAWESSNGKEFLSFALQYEKELTPGKKIFNKLKGEKSITVEEYFWPKSQYKKWFEEAGYRDVVIEEHKATDHPELWISEQEFPPFFTIRGTR